MPTLPVINSSVFSEQQIAEFLAAATIPVRLACNDEKGFPLVASHWFAYHDGLLYCAIHKASRFAKLLSRDPRCGFEIAGDSPPYRGVRGQGNAELISKQGGSTAQRAAQSLPGRHPKCPRPMVAQPWRGRAGGVHHPHLGDQLGLYRAHGQVIPRIFNPITQGLPMPLQKGFYRHFKGNLYELLELATHSETNEPMVVYRALYGERGIWVRPLAMFDETIERDGATLKRFAFVGTTHPGNPPTPKAPE